MFGPHGGFILAAYAVTFLVMIVLLIWLIADGRTVRRRLAELEARGVARRSSQRRLQS